MIKPPNYSALKNSIFRVINSSSKTEVCFLTIGPDQRQNSLIRFERIIIFYLLLISLFFRAE